MVSFSRRYVEGQLKPHLIGPLLAGLSRIGLSYQLSSGSEPCIEPSFEIRVHRTGRSYEFAWHFRRNNPKKLIKLQAKLVQPGCWRICLLDAAPAHREAKLVRADREKSQKIT
jgi:hypothetical protein